MRGSLSAPARYSRAPIHDDEGGGVIEVGIDRLGQARARALLGTVKARHQELVAEA